jgi:hypothetical protein
VCQVSACIRQTFALDSCHLPLLATRLKALVSVRFIRRHGLLGLFFKAVDKDSASGQNHSFAVESKERRLLAS